MQEILNEIGSEQKCPVAVMMRDDKVLCGLRHYTPDKWKEISVWTIPGGRCDAGESIEQTLRREVEEEVGITEFEIVEFVGEVPGAKEGDIVPIFLCKTKQDFTLMKPEKFSEWRWVTIDEYVSEEKYSGFNPVFKKLVIEFLSTIQS